MYKHIITCSYLSFEKYLLVSFHTDKCEDWYAPMYVLLYFGVCLCMCM